MRRLASILLVSVLALVAACGGDEDGGGDFSDVDADDLLDRSATTMEGVDTFHFVVEHKNGDTQIVAGLAMTRAEGDVQGTDRMQLQVEARFAATNIETGIVVLPGESYLQNPLTGRWQEQEIDISDLFDPATGVTGLMRAVSDVEVIDREAVDGVDSYVLSTQVDSGNLTAFVGNAQPGTQVTARVWIGAEDLLVRRIEIEGPVAPNDAEDILRRLSLSGFGEPVEISAPS
ncbi:MAG: LppX_LprAFG lipoprotein [Dehalococcoidia bacterium]